MKKNNEVFTRRLPKTPPMIKNIWHSSAAVDRVDILVDDIFDVNDLSFDVLSVVVLSVDVCEAEFWGVSNSFDFCPSRSSTT